VPGRHTQRGFTIVEVGFSIAIIALLMGLLLIGLNSMNKSARRAVERQNVASLKMGVDHFQDTFGFLPPLVNDDRAQPDPGLREPVKTRPIAGATRPAPVIYHEENPADWEFLRGEGTGTGGESYQRFSVHSLAYYLLGALDEDVDGVQGPGFRSPQPDGSFRVAGGQRTEPLFDTSKNPEGVYRGDTARGQVELRDRNGVAYRYYRWLPGDEDGEIKDAGDLNIPELLGSAKDDPQLRSAKFAIVAAGPNRVFGEEETEDDLEVKLGLPAGDQRAVNLGRQDNIVEVGQ
jgi:type II secretory pathway pseudopilin PulG